MKGKILLTENFHPHLSKSLTELGYQCVSKPGITEEEILSCIGEFTGIIVATGIAVQKKMIDAGVKLKFIARAGSGMEHIDVGYARSKNISCINSPEGNSNSVGEHAVGLLLSLFHNITKSFMEIKEGQWRTEENRVHELTGKTIGIIGYGNTGRAFAKKLSVFNVQVLAFDKYLINYSDEFSVEASMEKIFSEADVVSIHLPLTEETYQMVNGDYLNSFSKKIFLINTSRGKIVVHRYLLKMIEEEKVAGAALDVYENEEMNSFTGQERETFQSLLQSKKVIITPHIAGKSFESRKNIADVLVRKILMEN